MRLHDPLAYRQKFVPAVGRLVSQDFGMTPFEPFLVRYGMFDWCGYERLSPSPCLIELPDLRQELIMRQIFHKESADIKISGGVKGIVEPGGRTHPQDTLAESVDMPGRKSPEFVQTLRHMRMLDDKGRLYVHPFRRIVKKVFDKLPVPPLHASAIGALDRKRQP